MCINYPQKWYQLEGSTPHRQDGQARKGGEPQVLEEQCWNGRRWLIEIIISAFKRMFGDHMHSRKWEHMVQEIRLRMAQYNRWLEAAEV